MVLKEAVKTIAFDAVRAVVYAVVFLTLLVALSAIVGDKQAKLLSAIGCELGVPAKIVDQGLLSERSVRDPVILKACWTDEGLEPPAYFDGG